MRNKKGTIMNDAPELFNIVKQWETELKRVKKRQKKGTGSLLLWPLRTIVAVMMLNFCVRYGYRCVHHAIATRSFEQIAQNWIISLYSNSNPSRLSPRPISIIQLNISLCLHP